MEDSDHTNLQAHVLTKNQTTKKSTKDFIFPNAIPHTEKSVMSFNSEGYDRDTHIEPQLSIAYILVSCIPKVLVGGGISE